MTDVVYSIRITLTSVQVRDPDDGDVYFIARVGGTSKGRSRIFPMSAGGTADLRPLDWSWDIRVLGVPAGIPLHLEAWDHDMLSPDDDLGSLDTTVAAPWTAREMTATSPTGNLTLTYSLAVEIISLSRSTVAVVSRQFDGSTFRSTLALPNVALAVITDIAGLNRPGVDDRPVKPPGTTRGSYYQAGYVSEDDLGRIFISRRADDTWEKGSQFVEITAVVEPATVRLPAGAKMVWSFDDPDDPTNEGPDVHPSAGRILDPNDYDAAGLMTAAAGTDNDPSGKKKASPRFEETEPRYALSGTETLIDIPTRTTKVRFHISDIAGDNFRVRAVVKADPRIDLAVPASTGVMTAWNRIDLEYVKMASALEIPVDRISTHYDMACAQVDVSLKRVVSGATDLPSMGADRAAADAMCDTYASRAGGEFSKEGEKGWFFVVAANRFQPAEATRVLYEGPALANGDHVRLPAGTTLAAAPKMLRIFDPAKIVGATRPKPNDHSTHIKFHVTGRSGRDLALAAHDFHAVDDPDNSFLDADLSHYHFAAGSSIEVQVLDGGDQAFITAGISPGGADVGGKHFFGGRLLVFTQSMPAAEFLTVLCHELCHAFDNAHKCGNFDWKNRATRNACAMCYWFQFVLDDATPRSPIAWSQNRAEPDLCAQHLRHMRDFHLEDNPGLGWGSP
jgi:hypothetical protein